MNDFSELEDELKKLRPAQPTRGLFIRIEQAIADLADQPKTAGKIVQPARFKLNWIALGTGLAAAAVFLVFARINVERAPKQTKIAQEEPRSTTRSTTVPATLVPSGTTQVVYHTRDEGLYYPTWSEEPVRRVRYQKQESLQWRNPKTGASLLVSYPTEEVVLTPVSGQ